MNAFETFLRTSFGFLLRSWFVMLGFGVAYSEFDIGAPIGYGATLLLGLALGGLVGGTQETITYVRRVTETFWISDS